MVPIVSVIICTHNPRFDYLGQVLQGLQAQTLPCSEWELLLIDNASEQLLSEKIDLSWHPNAYHIRENQLGLTPARVRGIQDAKAEILVLVDDDNILEPDYLEIALKIGKDWPMIGAWGGQAKARFEETPPDWTKSFWGYLAIREFDQDKWSNLLNQLETVPFGTGLCVRKFVAEKYVELVKNDPKRANLDRKGNLLLSCGDVDLALTSCDLGLGTGLFTALKLTHIMPPSRFQEDYLLKILEGTCYSITILEFLRGKTPSKHSWKKKLVRQSLWLKDKHTRKAYQAIFRGSDLAAKEIYSLKS